METDLSEKSCSKSRLSWSKGLNSAMHPLSIFTVTFEYANMTIGYVFWWYKSATLQTGELIHRNHAKLN